MNQRKPERLQPQEHPKMTLQINLTKSTFEFENIGDSDQTISSLVSWHCYADGYAVDTSYEAGADADDMIDATLSP